MDPIVYVLYLCFLDNKMTLYNRFQDYWIRHSRELSYAEFGWSIHEIKQKMKWKYKLAFWFEMEHKWSKFSIKDIQDILEEYDIRGNYGKKKDNKQKTQNKSY